MPSVLCGCACARCLHIWLHITFSADLQVLVCIACIFFARVNVVVNRECICVPLEELVVILNSLMKKKYSAMECSFGYVYYEIFLIGLTNFLSGH